MYIVSCVPPNPYVRHSGDAAERKDIALTLRKYLGMMYELAMDEKAMRPYRPDMAMKWFRSSYFFEDFHQCFFCLQEFEVEMEDEAGQRCQMCSLMKAVRMVALPMLNKSSCDNAILDRIAKCLALHKGASGGEAAAALAAAQRLMKLHGISENAVRYADVKETFASSSVKVTPSQWESFLAAVVADAFCCKSMFQPTRISSANWIFIGGKVESQIAAYTFSTLLFRLKSARRKRPENIPETLLL